MSEKVSSEQSAANRPALQVWAHRALIRNDEARIEHLTAMMDEIPLSDESALKAANDSLDRAHESCAVHSFELYKRAHPEITFTPEGTAIRAFKFNP